MVRELAHVAGITGRRARKEHFPDGAAVLHGRLMRSTSPSLVSLLALTLLGCADAAAQPDPVLSTPEDGVAVVSANEDASPAARKEGTVTPTSTTYPAPHPAMPQIPKNGGPVLHDPRIVTVTFPDDPWREKIEAFGEQVGKLAWWTTVHDGYGVGPAASGGHVAVEQAPDCSLSDGDVTRWLGAKIGDGTLPAPTDQSIYLLYYPAATTVTLGELEGGGASCQVFLGYHNTIDVAWQGQSVPVAYAVINRCNDDLDQLTVTASHELTEAATDPRPIDSTTAGWVTIEDNAWTGLGGENGDMCAGVSGATEGGWALTRVWNNRSAAAGDQPCLPAPAGKTPYYNAGIVHERLEIHPGESGTTEVDCYSFGPLPARIAVEAQVAADDPLTISFDKKTCTNGDTLTMTVAVGAQAPHKTDYHYALLSTLGAKSGHVWRGMVHVD
jgi:hypothetical protein